MTFTQKLQKELEVFNELSKTHAGYKKTALLEVLEYLKEEKKLNNNKTVYNSELKSKITKAENITDPILLDYLDTEVYLAQQDYQKELDNAYQLEMEAKGYIKLTRDITYRGKIELIAQRSLDWTTSNISITATIKELSNGNLFIIPKGNRTRGYYITSLEHSFYKPLN